MLQPKIKLFGTTLEMKSFNTALCLRAIQLVEFDVKLNMVTFKYASSVSYL